MNEGNLSSLHNLVQRKISVQPHTIVKQICFPNGNVLFLLFFSLSKNWMHNVVWGCAEILPSGFLWSVLKLKPDWVISIANQKRRGIRPETKMRTYVRKINKSAASLKVIITKSRFFFSQFSIGFTEKATWVSFSPIARKSYTLRSSEAQSLSALLWKPYKSIRKANFCSKTCSLVSPLVPV